MDAVNSYFDINRIIVLLLDDSCDRASFAVTGSGSFQNANQRRCEGVADDALNAFERVAARLQTIVDPGAAAPPRLSLVLMSLRHAGRILIRLPIIFETVESVAVGQQQSGGLEAVEMGHHNRCEHGQRHRQQRAREAP